MEMEMKVEMKVKMKMKMEIFKIYLKFIENILAFKIRTALNINCSEYISKFT